MRTLFFLLLAAGLAACEASDARTVDPASTELVAADEDTRIRRVWARSGDYGTPSPDGRLATFVDWSTGDVAVHDLTSGESRRVTDKGTWVENGSWAEEPLFSPDGSEIAYTYGDVQAGVNPFVYQLRIVGIDGDGDRVVFQFPDTDGWIAAEDWREDRGILVRIFPDPDGPSSLSLMSPDDGSLEEVRSFTSEEAAPREAYFSPDGRRVAYRADSEVRVLSLDGGGERTLDVAARALLGWEDDGALLAHTAREGVSGFWRLPLAGGDAAEPELVRGGIPAVVPGGEARGRFYYHVLVDVPKLHVASIDPDGGRILSQPVPVTGVADGEAQNAAWSPDGRRLAYFLRDQDRQMHLMLRSADGDQTVELAALGGNRRISDLTWTRDGSVLHYLEWENDDESVLWRVDARSGERTEVLRAPMGQALVTPDGERIVLMREGRDDRDRPSGLIVRELAGGRERVLDRRISRAFSISPDGRTVAAVLGGSGRNPEDRVESQLLLFPIEGGEPTVLAETSLPEHWEYNAGRLPWTADGRYILAVHGGWDGIPHHLMAVPVDDGEPRRFFRTRGSNIFPDVHPDGQRVAFIGGDTRTEMWVLEDLD